MDENNVILLVLGLLVVLIGSVMLYSCMRNDDNRRYNYVGDSVERNADKRFIYTPMKQAPVAPQKIAQVNQPSQIRYGGIVPMDDGLNEYQASAYPIFMLNQKEIGLNPAQDRDKINKFYADYKIGGGTELDTQLHHDMIASIKPNYTIYA